MWWWRIDKKDKDKLIILTDIIKGLKLRKEYMMEDFIDKWENYWSSSSSDRWIFYD